MSRYDSDGYNSSQNDSLYDDNPYAQSIGGQVDYSITTTQGSYFTSQANRNPDDLVLPSYSTNANLYFLMAPDNNQASTNDYKNFNKTNSKNWQRFGCGCGRH